MRTRGLSPLASVAVAAVAAATTSTFNLCAQNVTWTQRKVSPEPSARCCHAMVYDSKRQRTVLFGGWNGSAVMGDTWEWDGSKWTRINPTQSPSARCCHAMVFDATRGKTLLFGGANGLGAILDLGDTWEYDGTTWTQPNPTTLPPARRSPMMATHQAKVVLFGGGQGSSFTVPLNDTWEWDGRNWTRMSPTNSPPARWWGAMAAEPLRARALLFGGAGTTTSLQDTWEWDGKDWTALSPRNRPSARSGCVAVYELHRSRVLLCGGPFAGNETWAWNGSDWISLPTATRAPARGSPGMSYDSSRKVVTLFGGSLSGPRGETWELVPSTVASFSDIGNGCTGSAGTPGLGATSSGPILGKRFDVQVLGIPASTSAVFLLFGASRTRWGSTSLPWDMGVVGLSGCWLHVSADALLLLSASNGSAGFGVVVPNDRNLLQLTYYNQVYVPDRNLGVFGATMSNAARAVVGDR